MEDLQGASMYHSVSIGDDALIRQRPGVIAAGSVEGMVVLDPEQGEFLELSATAGRIWSLLEEPITIPLLCQRIIALFDIDLDSCRGDVAAFVAQLADRGLIEIV
jgi:hypothetical protein